MTRVGIPTSSEIWVSLSNQEKRREAKHFSSEDPKRPIYRPHGLSVATSSVEARAHLRHLLRLDKRDGFPWNRAKEENVSLIKGTYGALKKGNILPWKRANRRISPSVSAREGVISLEDRPMAVGLGKAIDVPERTYSAKLPRRESTWFSDELIAKQDWKQSWTQPLWRRLYVTYHQQSSLKYFGVWTSPLQTYENFEGGLVDT